MLDLNDDDARTTNPWGGHRPLTTTALQSIFDKRLAGEAGLTVADRVLYTVCEIRCAVATRSLVRRLRSEDSIGAIRRASTAFAAIGAVQYARDLDRAAGEFANALTSGLRQQCLAVLEDRLLCTEDPIDALIAHYAWGCLVDCLRSANQSQFGTSLS
jgi:hypothetical protein